MSFKDEFMEIYIFAIITVLFLSLSLLLLVYYLYTCLNRPFVEDDCEYEVCFAFGCGTHIYVC